VEEWLDRDRVETQLPASAISFHLLTYDPDTGQYCANGEPFTGVSVIRRADGRLQSVVHYVDGYSHGVSVAWSPGGQPQVYNEMEFGVCHGWHLKWSEAGSIVEEFRCHEGRPIRS